MVLLILMTSPESNYLGNAFHRNLCHQHLMLLISISGVHITRHLYGPKQASAFKFSFKYPALVGPKLIISRNHTMWLVKWICHISMWILNPDWLTTVKQIELSHSASTTWAWRETNWTVPHFTHTNTHNMYGNMTKHLFSCLVLDMGFVPSRTSMFHSAFGLMKHAGSRGNKTPMSNTLQENKCILYHTSQAQISIIWIRIWQNICFPAWC